MTHMESRVWTKRRAFRFFLFERYCALVWRGFNWKHSLDSARHCSHQGELNRCWNKNTDRITRVLADRLVIKAANYSQIISKILETEVPRTKASQNLFYSKTGQELVWAKREEHLDASNYLSPTAWWFALPSFRPLLPLRRREYRSQEFLTPAAWSGEKAWTCCLLVPVPWRNRWWGGIHTRLTKPT